MESKPLNCDRNAERWANEFMLLMQKGMKPTHDLMIAWFANAIMCGVDTEYWKLQQEIEAKDKALNIILKKTCLEQYESHTKEFHDFLSGLKSQVIEALKDQNETR